jgi:hypothetical protein
MNNNEYKTVRDQTTILILFHVDSYIDVLHAVSSSAENLRQKKKPIIIDLNEATSVY